MNTQTEKYEFELYLEGTRVPFTQINISSSGAGVSATVSLPFNPEILEILPNTLCHMFFKKYGTDWQLLFDGYVLAYSISDGHNAKMMNIQCKDISYNLDIMWKFYTNRQNIGETYGKIIRHFGAPVDHRILYTRPSKETKRQGIISKSNSVMELLNQMITDVVTTGDKKGDLPNSYFVKLTEAAKFLHRFYHVDDDQVSEILDLELLKSLTSRAAISGLQTTRSIMDMFFGLTYYHTSYVSSPPYVGGKLHQILYKPDNFIIPAPLCNVVFPDMVSSFSFSRNFMAEPTRLALKSMPLVSNTSTTTDMLEYIAYAPYELKELEKENYLYYRLINDEPYRGIYPVIETTSQSIRLQGIRLQNINEKASTPKFMAIKNAADYLLLKRQTAARTFNSGACTFNPNLVLNFPGVVIVDPIIVMGNITSIDHSINAGGNITTSFSMSNCRISPVEISKDNKKTIALNYPSTFFDWANSALSMSAKQIALARLIGEDDSPYPSWLNTNYLPASIDATYLSMLGCKSVMSASANPNNTAKITNVRKLYNDYVGYKEKNASHLFTDFNTKRNIATKKEFFERFIGLSPTSDEGVYIDSSGDYLKAGHKSIISKYKEKISEGVGSF